MTIVRYRWSVRILWPELMIQFRVCGKDKRTHVRRNEHPLWQLVTCQILLKHGKVLDLRQAVQIACHRVVTHQRTSSHLVSTA